VRARVKIARSHANARAVVHAAGARRAADVPRAIRPRLVARHRAVGIHPYVRKTLEPRVRAAPTAGARANPAASAASPLRWLVLGPVLLLLLGAAAAGALVWLRRRPRLDKPGARELELEAELQEMIAEERAKQGRHLRRP
jgi:hypothetical protein